LKAFAQTKAPAAPPAASSAPTLPVSAGSEDDDIAMAIALSIQESSSAQSTGGKSEQPSVETAKADKAHSAATQDAADLAEATVSTFVFIIIL